MKIGITELLLILVVALFVLGPDKLPAYAKKLGEALGQFRRATEDATRDIKESIVDPLAEAQKPLRDAVEPLEELNRSVRDNVNQVQSSLADIGKPKPAPKPEPPKEEPQTPSEDSTELKEETEPCESEQQSC